MAFDAEKSTGILYSKESVIQKVLFSFGLIIAAGYGWRFFNPGGIDRRRARHALSVTVLHFFLPALAFVLVATAPVDRTFIAVPLTAAAVTLSAIVLGFAAYRLYPPLRVLEGPAFGVVILAAAFGNVTYLGLPVINETLGPSFGYVAVLYDLLAATPILLTLGVFLAARHGGARSFSVRDSIARVLKLPPLWGVAAGIAVNAAGVTVPRIVLDTATLMGRSVIPIMVFTVGLALDFSGLKRLPAALPALAIKLVVSPLIAWLAGSRMGITGGALKAVTIEGSMPVMVLSLVIADEFELDVSLAAACIAVSTIALLFTMPAMMHLLF